MQCVFKEIYIYIYNLSQKQSEARVDRTHVRLCSIYCSLYWRSIHTT